MVNLNLTLNVTTEDLLDSMSSFEGARELILALDLRMADAEFTEEIIISLFKSLMTDYTKEEMLSILQVLENILKLHHNAK